MKKATIHGLQFPSCIRWEDEYDNLLLIRLKRKPTLMQPHIDCANSTACQLQSNIRLGKRVKSFGFGSYGYGSNRVLVRNL